MAAPQLIERGAAASMDMIPIGQAGCGLLTLIGLWLTYVSWIAEPATEN
jgi:hypothetical protein